MRRIGVQLNCRRSDQNEEMARRREMRQGNRWSIKNPSCHGGQEGCVWLEKVTEITVAAASEPGQWWCWAE